MYYARHYSYFMFFLQSRLYDEMMMTYRIYKFVRFRSGGGCRLA